MNPTKVACAIIEENGLVLIAQRSASMLLPLKWEFPGGKLDQGEESAQCIIREINEELGLEISVVESLPGHVYHYPDSSIELIPLRCRRVSGEVVLHEHSAVAWVLPEHLHRYDFAEADISIRDSYLDLIANS